MLKTVLSTEDKFYFHKLAATSNWHQLIRESEFGPQSLDRDLRDEHGKTITDYLINSINDNITFLAHGENQIHCTPLMYILYQLATNQNSHHTNKYFHWFLYLIELKADATTGQKYVYEEHEIDENADIEDIMNGTAESIVKHRSEITIPPLHFYIYQLTKQNRHNANIKFLPTVKAIIEILFENGANSIFDNKSKTINVTKLTINPLIKQWLETFAKELDGHENQAASKIQRAFRRFKYLKQKEKNIFPMLEWSLPAFMLAPIEPVIDNEIIPARKERWASAHEEAIKTFAEAAFKLFNYIPFIEFTKALEETIKKWNQFIASLPPDKRNYVIHTEGGHKSFSWVIALAKTYLDFPPIGIIDWPNQKIIAFDAENEPTEIDHILILDDAIYSGGQLTALLRDYMSIFEKQNEFTSALTNAKITVLTPFISEYALARFSLTQINFINSYKLKALEKFHGKVIRSSITASFFQHKIPYRGISVQQGLDGTLVNKEFFLEGDDRVPTPEELERALVFDPCVPPPYKDNYYDYLAEHYNVDYNYELLTDELREELNKHFNVIDDINFLLIETNTGYYFIPRADHADKHHILPFKIDEDRIFDCLIDKPGICVPAY